MLKAIFNRQYRAKGSGNVVFVFNVTGNEADLAKFKEAQGEFYREDDEKKPLYFTTNYIGDKIDLIITKNNKVMVDDSQIQKAKSLSNSLGGNLGQAIAEVQAKQILGIKTADLAPEPEVKPAE